MITNDFANKVLRMGTVDTKKYRYTTKERYDHNSQWVEIIRLPLNKLDTTAAIDGWETIKKIGG